MKILLFGKTGQVGWELQRSLAPLGDVIALDTRSTDYCGDFLNPQSVAHTVLAIRPDIIVNASAYTAVDKAESDRANAYTINAETPGLMAQAAHKIGARLVHYSTDYVFDGSGSTAWRETDTPAPLSVYGASKLAGEHAIAASGARHLIFRTSWVYAARGNNFAKTMLRLARERESLSVINDQIGAPTGADLLADITAQALTRWADHPALGGLYHLAAAGETSWYGYAQHVFALARRQGMTLELQDAQFKAIPTSEYKTAAQRPLNSRLNCDQLKSHFSLHLPDWTVGVNRMLAEIL
ncbi:MAG: dTDP-4-dehydrorhamnose reductase [Burkholderiaceae bacterium]